MDIQKDLPNTPAEIIESWIEPVAQREDYGWPPTEYNAWRYLLGNDSSLDYFAGLQWEKKKIALNPAMIVKSDMDAIRDIFQAQVVGVSFSPGLSKPAYHDIFRRHIDHLKDHGVFETPVVLEEIDDGLRVLDGFYRLCAFFFMLGYLQYENTETRAASAKPLQRIWIGKLAGK